MKRSRILLTLLLAGFTLAMSAQHSLLGVWQLQMPAQQDGGAQWQNVPVWKIYKGDGTYCAFMLVNGEMQCVLTGEGAFTILSDSTYSERVDENLFQPELKGKTNHIGYRFIDADHLGISVQAEGAAEPMFEMWKRVKAEMPQAAPQGPPPADGRPQARRPRPQPNGPDAADLDDDD